MSQKIYLTLFPVAAALILSSCTSVYGDKGIIRNRNTEYLKARSYAPLKIPPGMSSSTVDNHYPVSDRNYPGSTTPVDLTPPELRK